MDLFFYTRRFNTKKNHNKNLHKIFNITLSNDTHSNFQVLRYY